MAWGVLDDPLLASPPGTVNLTNDTNSDGLAGQHAVKKRGNIVLQPQPSDSPNDPLNWSQGWKIAHILVVVFGSGVTNGVATMITPGLIPLSERFGVSGDVASSFMIGAVGFWTALGSFFVVSGASIWGRRPFYVLSIVFLAISNYLAYLAETFPVLAIMRTITGFASAPFLSLATATISDVFFVHERGIVIAVWTVLLNCGAQLGQVIAGFIVDAMGVSAVFAFASLVYVVLFPMAYFLVLESAYSRPPNATSDGLSHGGLDRATTLEFEDLKEMAKVEPKEPYRRQLTLFRGRLSNLSFWKGVLKPPCLIVLPTILFSTILFSTYFAFLVGIPILMSVVFSGPPYSLTPSQVGLTNLPLVATSVIGGPLNGWVSDVLARFMARRNRTNPGMFEPEFRLVLLLVSAPVTAVGLIGLGMSIDNNLPLVWPLVWISVISFGAIGATQIALTYVVDCFTDQSSQAFTVVNLVAATVIFVGSGGLIAWFGTAGPLVVFGVLASFSAIVTALTIPVYIFGKRIRGMVARAEWTHSLTGYQKARE
ncbi:major facilitator superfamily domain-containing protein [Ilyonectria destructans]|nr:major facilitator superfamily domain-containing protein [Ilyonectria destructans]